MSFNLESGDKIKITDEAAKHFEDTIWLKQYKNRVIEVIRVDRFESNWLRAWESKNSYIDIRSDNQFDGITLFEVITEEKIEIP